MPAGIGQQKCARVPACSDPDLADYRSVLAERGMKSVRTERRMKGKAVSPVAAALALALGVRSRGAAHA